MLGGGIYPGMITATVGTGLMIAVAATSAVIVKRRLRYEAWYAVHLAAYAAIALAWFHQIPTGNELVLDTAAADYWRGLYLADARLPARRSASRSRPCSAIRYRLRVAAVEAEATGRGLGADHGAAARRSGARPGQFFLWRFLDRQALVGRASVLALGRARRPQPKDHGQGPRRLLRRPRHCRRGTRVVAEGPLGHFTEDARAARRGRADRRRHRHHARSRARGADGRRRRARLPRRPRGGRRLPRGARDAVAGARHPARARRRRPRDSGGRAPALARRTCGSSSPTSTTAMSTSAARPR